MQLGFHYGNYDGISGPYKVYKNLKNGFDRLGVDYVENKISDDFNVAITSWCNYAKSLPQNSLMGPNLCILPQDEPYIFERYNHFIVPSLWCKKLYQRYTDKNIYVWSVGIDTDLFKDEKNKSTKKCFIYYKNRDAQDVKNIAHYLIDVLKYEVNMCMYGKYSEEQLIQACQDSDFAVLLTNTESQGIAYMEILSSNTPCLVFNHTLWDYRGKEHQIEATSVPFFDDKCGMVFDTIHVDNIRIFIDKLQSFHPRDYILENHTIEKSTQEYLNLIKEINNPCY